MSRHFVCIAALAASVCTASAGQIVQYDPIGAYCGATPVAPVSGSAYSPSNLTEVGLPNGCNTNVLPVGPVSTSPSIQLGQYLDFTVTGAITPTVRRTLPSCPAPMVSPATWRPLVQPGFREATTRWCSTSAVLGRSPAPPNSECMFTTHPPPGTLSWMCAVQRPTPPAMA